MLHCGRLLGLLFGGERAHMILLVHITAQAHLAEVAAGTTEAILSAHLASPILVVRVICRRYRGLSHQSLAHPSQPFVKDHHQSPEAEATGAPWSTRVIGCCIRGLLARGVLETGWLALVCVVMHMAKARVNNEILAVPPRVCMELRRGGNGAVCFAEALNCAIWTTDIQLGIIQPARDATIVLWSTSVERFWGMTAGI